MGLKRSRLEVERAFLVVIGFLAIVNSNAQLDYRPGPPYPDTYPGHGVRSHSAKLPLVTPDIMRTLTKAFGSGIQVYPPGPSRQIRTTFPNQHSYDSSPPTQIRYSQAINRHYPQYIDSPQSQSPNAQTAHVYFSQDVQKPMSNVIVKFQQSQRQRQNNYYHHDQPIQQYSQPDPVVQPIVQVVQYPVANSNQYNSEMQQGHGQTNAAPVQQFAQSQNQPQQNYGTPAFRQESHKKSPLAFSIGLEFPPKKWQPHHSSKPGSPMKAPLSSYYAHPVKTYRVKAHSVKGKHNKKPLHSEAFPVFTTLGRGLDGLNAVRRVVKKGSGHVLASGVKIGGKLAGIGAGVVAKVIKVASSI